MRVRVCLVGLERFAEEPRIVLRLAEYMSGGVLARRDSETRRVLQAVFTERMEFAPFNEGETRGYQFAGPGSYGGILLGDTYPTPGSLVCNCGYARFSALSVGQRPRDPQGDVQHYRLLACERAETHHG